MKLMSEFMEYISDFSKWDEIVPLEEIEDIIKFQRERIEAGDESFILRFLMEKIESNAVMFPFYVWVELFFNEDDSFIIDDLKLYLPFEWDTLEGLNVPEEIAGREFKSINSVSYKYDMGAWPLTDQHDLM